MVRKVVSKKLNKQLGEDLHCARLSFWSSYVVCKATLVRGWHKILSLSPVPSLISWIEPLVALLFLLSDESLHVMAMTRYGLVEEPEHGYGSFLISESPRKGRNNLSDLEQWNMYLYLPECESSKLSFRVFPHHLLKLRQPVIISHPKPPPPQLPRISPLPRQTHHFSSSCPPPPITFHQACITLDNHPHL